VKTEWDYTRLARAYRKRPGYADAVVDGIVAYAGLVGGERVCDVGAGTAHLTRMLLERGLVVDAVEPNDAMRAEGREATAGNPNVTWYEGVGEATGRPAGAFALVTFGSSFNVTDRAAALRESARILRPRGAFACLWNHRDLSDPLQAAIERAIAAEVPSYTYGARREDQTAVIEASGLFDDLRAISGTVTHRQTKDDCVEAWRSHATLQRQAGERFAVAIQRIEEILADQPGDAIEVPYTTRGWVATLIT
jgi:ubiquinone/menaquinone biosynthesis C-methylase UbiE